MQITRRQLLAAGASLPLMAAKRTPATPLLDRGFARVTRIADGVYATIADASKGPQCASNGGVIAGRDAVLIVEGHMQPEGAALEIEIARTFGKAPVRAAVDTHFHLDHSFGNRAYADQGIAIMAHEMSATLMKQRYVDVQGKDKTDLFAPWVRKAGQATGAADKKRREIDVERIRWMYSTIDSASITLPTELLRTPDFPKRIDLGGLTAVIEFHPGHTVTDLVIHVPERGVVFAGDLLFHRAYPVCIDADMIALRKALGHFSSYGRRTQFVPGHGPVCGQETVRDQIHLIDDLHRHAEKMIRMGVPAAEAERRYVVPAAFQNYRNTAWGWTVGAAMESYYRHAASPQS
ncbi:MAG: MBL fold metallo-hydrolase [Candidatus Solibacter usitatus]|nr:MBL fold metallo-hydrolase [Candidatus Solibacter usitatus]